MCGISGFYSSKSNFTFCECVYKKILSSMNYALRRRGPDDDGIFLAETCGLAHTRLSIIDLKTGSQPMSKGDYTIIFNGEIYNFKKLKEDLISRGCVFKTTSDTEVLLHSFIIYGPEFIKKVDGIFAIAIFDRKHDTLYLYRDYFGVKPLFYSAIKDTFVFSSEPKGLFCFPELKPELDMMGLYEIFGLGPARNPGCGIFKNVHEVLAGHYLAISNYGVSDVCYERLTSHPHEDNYETTIEKTRFLVTDAIKRQMVSDVPICTFLSGGIDSSLVSSVCAKSLQKKGEQLSTYSFDFVENRDFFESNSFQPSQDRPYADIMVEYLSTKHTYLECSTAKQLEYLEKSVDAHDFPCMADVDSSLLYFCEQVAKKEKVVLTGECADEVFGGYPWFHREEMLNCGTFPWTADLSLRKNVLNKEIFSEADMSDYVRSSYENAVKEVQILPEENETETNRRIISYLNIRFFMQTLLNRMDRTSMYSGLEARVPFADKALVDYVYNTPWEMKSPDNLVKGLLRISATGLLPHEILYRKKNPYPKTYHPEYEKKLAARLKNILSDAESPLRPLIDSSYIMKFLDAPKDYGKPWYGQLMAGPQMMAYLIQIDYFLRSHKVNLIL